jgi:hypothetical protein
VHEDKVVRIQATYRGHLTRKALKNGVGLFQKYGNGVSIREDRYGEDETEADSRELIFKEEHVFDNGAAYRGQWLRNQRHGYGE